MIPRSLDIVPLKFLEQGLAHGLHASTHRLQVHQPLLVKNRILENLGHNSGTVRGTRSDFCSGDLGEQGINPGGQRGRLRDDVDHADTLPVQTEVLRKGLRDGKLQVPSAEEVADCKGVLGQVARRKTLAVEVLAVLGPSAIGALGGLHYAMSKSANSPSS
jgi:hypothetical protein